MKKLLPVLCMITCFLGLTGCAVAKEDTEEKKVTVEVASNYAAELIYSMNEIVITGQESQYVSDEVTALALDSYRSALKDMGEFQSIIETEVIHGDNIVIHTTIQGSLRQAVVEILLDEEELVPTSIVTNVAYSFGELMSKAALNTVMGMGTVFAVLIIIILIISSFSLFNKEEKKEKRETIQTPVQPIRTEDVSQTSAQETEDLSKDLELVAVIAAAIAAYEGKASAEGYIVRSLRKRK